jgi:hypothetical protein
VLLIPAGIQRDGVQRKVCVGDLLPGQLMVIAVFKKEDLLYERKLINIS